MTVFLINDEDIRGLNNYMMYLREFPEHIKNFKGVLELLSASEGFAPPKEPILDPVVAKANESLTFWSSNLTPLRNLHRELYQQMKDLTQFYTAASSYITGLEKPDRKALITQEHHYRELSELSKPLKLANTHSVISIITPCNTMLLEHAESFQRYASSTSMLHQNIYTIIPRILDFMNTTLNQRANKAPLPGALIRLPWIKSPAPLSDPRDLTRAAGHITSVEKNYAHSTSAASNLSHYCYRLEQLLIEACHPLAKIHEQSTLTELSLAFKLAEGRLKEFRNLSSQMATLLQYSY